MGHYYKLIAITYVSTQEHYIMLYYFLNKAGLGIRFPIIIHWAQVFG